MLSPHSSSPCAPRPAARALPPVASASAPRRDPVTPEPSGRSPSVPAVSRSKIGRRLRNAAWMIRSALTHLPPRYLLQYEGGIGDSLLCSAICRELRRRGQRGIWVATRHGELFRGNPDVDRVLEPASRVDAYCRRVGARLVDPSYARFDPASDRHLYRSGHQVAVMCAATGITGDVVLRPYLHLTAAERAAGRLAPRQLVIQSSGSAARYAIPNKEWFPERFAAVAAALSRDHTLLQVGSATDPLLPGVRDLRGRTSLRETAALLSQAQLFIGLEGFLMHLARAVDCRSVIVYGGHAHPGKLGYSANYNLFTPLPCAPCTQRSACAHNRDCMRAITPEEVLRGVERQLALHGTALTQDVVTLHPGAGEFAETAAKETWPDWAIPPQAVPSPGLTLRPATA
jgi:hypothetical protein